MNVATRERWILGLGLACLLGGCGGRSADFGTLPQVSVPIEKQPEQDPTLFQDEQEPPTLAQKNQDPPDPKPLRSRDHYDFVLEFNKGEVRLLSLELVRTKNLHSTPRKMGRFALELWTGEEMIERVRFDFPLLGASDDKKGEDPLGKGLTTQTTVRLPAASRARSARVLDRKTRKELSISWPPDASHVP